MLVKLTYFKNKTFSKWYSVPTGVDLLNLGKLLALVQGAELRPMS